MLACCWSFLRWSRAAARASGSPMQPRRLDHQGREIEYCPPLPQSPQWLRPLEPASGRMVPVSLPRGVAWNGSTHQEVFHPCLCGWRRGQPPCVCQITSWRVWHRVRNIPGQPCVAAAVAAPAIPKLWNRRRSTGARGCTVVPHAPGHLAAYPYGTVLPSNRAAARDLQERDRCHARKLVGETELPYRRVALQAFLELGVHMRGTVRGPRRLGRLPGRGQERHPGVFSAPAPRQSSSLQPVCIRLFLYRLMSTWRCRSSSQ